jgi:HAD superfamily hydrolase (TIGR01509 family)
MSVKGASGRERESLLLSSAVFFDFGGTLDADGVPAGVRFHRAYLGSGGSLAYGTFAPLFRATDRRLAQLPGIRTAGFRASVFAQAALIHEIVPDAADVDRVALAAEFHEEAVAAAARNRPVLERLASTLRLGVVANGAGNLAVWLAELGLDHVFSVVVDSTVVGVEKPDARIFTAALTALGVEADAAWMVGDDPEADIRAAATLGLKTCWIAPPDREAPGGAAPTLRIATLADLEGFGG